MHAFMHIRMAAYGRKGKRSGNQAKRRGNNKIKQESILV